MKRLVLTWFLIAVGLVLVACGGTQAAKPTPTQQTGVTPTMAANQPQQWDSPPPQQLQEGVDYRATLHTSKGDIVIDLLEEETPITVNNFVFLAEQGFYTDVPFHRVIKGFMIQTGDPTGTGGGGPGYEFEDEPVTRNYTEGTVAMANRGANTNGSQFFIVQADMTGRLPKNYTIFGEVVEGMDVVDAIANVEVKPQPYNPQEASKPVEEVAVTSVDIITK